MKKKKRVCAYLILILTALSAASCELDGVDKIRAAELKGFIDTGAQMVIVDDRSEFEYRQGHIPGAINIPQERFAVLESLLPKDKGTSLVFYCGGLG